MWCLTPFFFHNVQYPYSSQGFNRYIYVNDNPLSLSDPSGYFAGNQILGLAAAIVVTWACDGTCSAYTSSFLAGAADGYISSGGNLQQTGLSGLEAMAFTYVGGEYGPSPEGTELLERSVTEGLIGGAFSEAGGGNFGDGFLGAFASSELSPAIGTIGGNENTAGYYSAANVATRTVVSAVVGGAISKLTGGDFSDGAVAAAMQRLYNDEKESHAPEKDKVPAMLVVVDSMTYYEGFQEVLYYQLENADKQVLTGGGYGLEEHLSDEAGNPIPPDPSHIQNTEGEFQVNQKENLFMDTINPKGAPSLIVLQKFTASYQGKEYPLSTELLHIVIGVPSAIPNVYTYTYFYHYIEP